MDFKSIRIRLFVGGVIDGCLTATGVAFGAGFATRDARIVLIAILSAAFSNVVASTFATVTGQLAEEANWAKTLGKKMQMGIENVRNLSIVRQFKKEAMTNWLIEGVGILDGSILPALPFFFLPVRQAITICAVISALILFLIGGLIGELSGENIIKFGSIVLIVGMVTAAITFSIQYIVELV